MTNPRWLKKLCLISLTFHLAVYGWLTPAAMAAAQPSLNLQLSTEGDVTIGDRIRVAVSGKNLADAYAYELNVTYDPLRLRFVNAKSEMKGFTLAPAVNGNRVKLAHTKTGNVKGENGDLTLAVLTFEAIAGGEAVVTLRKADLVDSLLKLTAHHPETRATVAIAGQPPRAYGDVAGHWAESSIKRASQLGIVSGYANGEFRPDIPVNRAEFATMLARAVDYPMNSGERQSFTDTATIPQWARSSVNAVDNARLIVGFEDGSFRAGRLLSRSEMAAIIVRAAGVAVEGSASTSFADDDLIPQWVKPYVAAGLKEKLLAGKGHNRFAPAAAMTRAEGVIALLNLVDYLENSR